MKFHLAAALVVLVASAVPPLASALAVSDVEVRSTLNQRLDARVRLLAVSQAELDSLSVNVHGDSRAGQPYIALRHEIMQDENGHYIRITTPDVVREPILTVIVEAAWSTGKLTREYALIIDPQ